MKKIKVEKVYVLRLTREELAALYEELTYLVGAKATVNSKSIVSLLQKILKEMERG